MDTFIQRRSNGLTLGSIYALIALGYTIVYGILKLLNFAHGDVFMVGAFIGFGVLQLFGGARPGRSRSGSCSSLMVLAAMVGCAVLGVAIERFAYRPLRNAPRIAPLISALGVSFFLAYSDAAPLRRRAPRLRLVLDGERRHALRAGIDIGSFDDLAAARSSSSSRRSC